MHQRAPGAPPERAHVPFETASVPIWNVGTVPWAVEWCGSVDRFDSEKHRLVGGQGRHERRYRDEYDLSHWDDLLLPLQGGREHR